MIEFKENPYNVPDMFNITEERAAQLHKNFEEIFDKAVSKDKIVESAIAGDFILDQRELIIACSSFCKDINEQGFAIFSVVHMIRDYSIKAKQLKPLFGLIKELKELEKNKF